MDPNLPPGVILSSSTPPSAPPPRKASPLITILLILVLLASIGASAYLYLQNQQLQSQITQLTQTPTPTPTTVAIPTASTGRYSNLTFQQFLSDNCQPGNPQYLSPEKLFLDLTGKLKPTVRQGSQSVICTSVDPNLAKIVSGYLSVSTIDNTLIIYDGESEELGHGGAPFLGFWGQSIYTDDDMRIGAYFNFGSGPALLGELPLTIRGEKKFTTIFKNPVFVNLNLPAIAADDPRLIESLKPYAEDTEFDSPELTKATAAVYDSIINQFFGTNLKPGTPEFLALEEMKRALSSITPN